MKRRLLLTLLICLIALPALADIEVHYLDVGNGDATIIIADSYTVLIDGGGSESSQFIYSYLRNTLRIAHIDAIIATHPHADHIGGLSAAFNACTVGAVYSSVPMYGPDRMLSYDSREFRSLVKYASKQGLDFILPSAGDTLQLGELTIMFVTGGYDGDITSYSSSQVNNLSLIVRLMYGSSSFLFTGDAEWRNEASAIRLAGDHLSANVLQAGHHGSQTSSNAELLVTVNPAYAVISCGAGNPYGHPAVETLSRYRQHSVPVLRTDEAGTIIFRSDGETLSFSCEKSIPLSTATDAEEREAALYIGNANSKKFHDPACPSVSAMKKKNKVRLLSREEAIERSFKPCGNCHP